MPSMPSAVIINMTRNKPFTRPVRKGINDGSVPPFFKAASTPRPMAFTIQPPIIHTAIAPINLGP